MRIGNGGIRASPSAAPVERGGTKRDGTPVCEDQEFPRNGPRKRPRTLRLGFVPGLHPGFERSPPARPQDDTRQSLMSFTRP